MADFEALRPEELRVIGALMEKEVTTPDYYPLSLNSLVAACNQKSSRDPVVAYSEELVVDTLRGLKSKQLVVQSDASRVPRYGENFVGKFGLIPSEAAILCLLILRGPQTVGELKSRAARMYEFPDLSAVRESFATLIDMGLVAKLPRQPGRKESRYAHLLAGDCHEEPSVPGCPEETGSSVDALAELRSRIDALEQEFHEFKRQFE